MSSSPRRRPRRPAHGRPAVRSLALVLAVCPWHGPNAQDTGDGGLAELTRRFDEQRRQLAQSGDASLDDFRALALEQAARLDEFAAGAPARAAVDAKLLQIDILAAFRLQERVRDALEAFPTERADALQLLAAAEIAGRLGMRERRERFVARGFEAARSGAGGLSFERRMRAAEFLMTDLVEVDKAETIYAEAAERADDDEQRARVAWYRCAAIRNREDLPEGAYEEALSKLADRFGDTRHGRIASDRLLALDFEPGGEFLPFVRVGEGGRGVLPQTLDGEDFDLDAWRGNAVIVDFFAAWDTRTHDRLRALRELLEAERGRGLRIVSVALDADRALLERTLARYDVTWPVIRAEDEQDADLALRFMVEQVPRTFVLDRTGKIVAINPFDRLADLEVLREAVAAALAGEGN